MSFIYLYMILTGLARKLLLSYNVPSSQELSFSTPGQEKLKTELSERTAEISKLRDQTSEQQRELERVRSKLQECEIQQGSLAAINQEMVRCPFFPRAFIIQYFLVKKPSNSSRNSLIITLRL